MEEKKKERNTEEEKGKGSFFGRFFSFGQEGNRGKSIFRKENMFLLIIAGVLLLIILIPFDKRKNETLFSFGNSKQADGTGAIYEQELSASTEERLYEEQLEKRLEDMLSKMEGVGKAEVMISYSDATEGKESSTLGSTSIFGTVSAPSGHSGRRVEGILVLCEGGNRSDIVFQVSETIQALFPLEAHKIKVTKLSHSS